MSNSVRLNRVKSMLTGALVLLEDATEAGWYLEDTALESVIDDIKYHKGQLDEALSKLDTIEFKE